MAYIGPGTADSCEVVALAYIGPGLGFTSRTGIELFHWAFLVCVLAIAVGLTGILLVALVRVVRPARQATVESPSDVSR